MNRSFYSDTVQSFCTATKQEILGELAENSGFDIIQNQRDAWAMQIDLLKPSILHMQTNRLWPGNHAHAALNVKHLQI